MKIMTIQTAKPDKEIWRGRRVLITGHTGFMGGWLSVWLHELGAYTTGMALPPPTAPSFYEAVGVKHLLVHEFIGDIRNADLVTRVIAETHPNIVFHLAAQPLVREAFLNPAETFEINVMGTLNVLQAVRSSPEIGAILVVTSDKVYDNHDHDTQFREPDRLGGKEPYGSSKACAELVVECYRRAYFENSDTGVAAIRAGNVIGGGDWANGRLLPDIVRAFSQGRRLTLRCPDAVRPWQHVIEPLRGYLLLAERLTSSGGTAYSGAWNFGPRSEDHRTVHWIADRCAKIWGEGAEWTVETTNIPEAKHLAISSEKAQRSLGWNPGMDLDAALQSTLVWYKSYTEGKPMLPLTVRQIEEVCAR